MVWLTLGLGLTTTALGVAYGVAAPDGTNHPSASNEVVASVVGSLGAGVVGAALSILITNLANRDGRDDIIGLLSEMVGARFASSERELSVLRTNWHHYHVTTVGGRYVWRHIRFHSDRWSASDGSLRYRTRVTDGQGHAYEFTAEVGVRGSHVVLLNNGAEGEIGAQSTEIFPLFLAHGYRPYHCGIGAYRTWDNRNIVGKIIMSREPIAPADDDGSISEDHFGRLDDVWDSDFKGQHELLPSAQLNVP